MIYLDNAASAPVLPNVVNIMQKCYKKYFANPSSLHGIGNQAKNLADIAKINISKIINCSPQYIYFSSSATESANTLMKGYIEFMSMIGDNKNEIIITSIEHPCIYNTAMYLKRKGYIIKIAPVDINGKIICEKILDLISAKTVMVCFASVNNEIGTIQDVDFISERIKEKNNELFICIDAVQSFMKISYKFNLKYVDAFFVSGHKIGAPRGTSFFYLNPSFKIQPLLHGGGQENGYRSGTPDIVGLFLLSLAIKQAYTKFDENYLYAKRLRSFLIEELRNFDLKFKKTIRDEMSSPYILSLILSDMKSDFLISKLSENNIFISAKSACSSSTHIRSRVLESISLPSSDIDSCVRISFFFQNTIDELSVLVRSIKEASYI